MEFHTLPRRDLQSLCKKNRIPANLSNLAMADALRALDAVEGIEEVLQLQSPQKPEMLSPEPPRTGRRTAAKERQASPLPRSRRVTAKAVVDIVEGKEEVLEEKPEAETPGVRTGRRVKVVPTPVTRPVAEKAAVEIVEGKEEVLEEKPEAETPGVRTGRRVKVVPTPVTRPVAAKAAVEIVEGKEEVLEEKPEAETPGVRTGRRVKVVPTPVTRPVTRTRVSKKVEEGPEGPVTGRKSVKKAEEAVVKTGRSTRGRAAAKMTTLMQESEDDKVSTRRTRSKAIPKMASLVQDTDEPEAQDGDGETELQNDRDEMQLEEISNLSIEAENEESEDKNLDSKNVEEIEEAHEEDSKSVIDDESPIRGLVVEQNQEEGRANLTTEESSTVMDIDFLTGTPDDSLPEMKDSGDVLPTDQAAGDSLALDVAAEADIVFDVPAPTESDVTMRSEGAILDDVSSPSPVAPSPEIITEASLSPIKESSESSLSPVSSSPDIITEASLSPIKKPTELELLSRIEATIESDATGENQVAETNMFGSESDIIHNAASSSSSPVVSSPEKLITEVTPSPIKGSSELLPPTIEEAEDSDLLPAIIESDVTGEILVEETKVFESESDIIHNAAASSPFSVVSLPEKLITEVTPSPIKGSSELLPPTIEEAEDSDLLSPAIIESDVTGEILVEETKVFESESATILNAAASSPFSMVSSPVTITEVTTSPIKGSSELLLPTIEEAEKSFSLSPAKDSAISPLKETFEVDTITVETDEEIDAPVQEGEGEMKLDLCSDIVDPEPSVEQISEKLGGLEIDLGNNKENNAGEKKVKNTDRKPVLFEKLSMRKLKVIYKEKLISMKNTKNEECNKVEVRRTALSALDKNQQ